MSAEAIVIPPGWGFAPGACLMTVRSHGRVVQELRSKPPQPRSAARVVAERIEFILAHPEALKRNGWRFVADRFGLSRATTYYLLKRARDTREERAAARRIGIPIPAKKECRNVQAHR